MNGGTDGLPRTRWSIHKLTFWSDTNSQECKLVYNWLVGWLTDWPTDWLVNYNMVHIIYRPKTVYIFTHSFTDFDVLVLELPKLVTKSHHVCETDWLVIDGLTFIEADRNIWLNKTDDVYVCRSRWFISLDHTGCTHVKLWTNEGTWK